MEHYLKITTEVNGEKIIAHRKMWLEYPKEANDEHLKYEAARIASKLTGISTTKLEFVRHYLFDYEEYNEEKHGHLGCVDLNELYESYFDFSIIE